MAVRKKRDELNQSDLKFHDDNAEEKIKHDKDSDFQLYLDSLEIENINFMRELDESAFRDAGKMLEVLSGEKTKSGIEKIIEGNLEDLIIPETHQENGILYSHFDFIKMVDVQAETIMKYIREGKIVADSVIGGTKYYFKKNTIDLYVEKFGWSLITMESLIKIFYRMICDMGMSYSYKHVLIKAMLNTANESGTCSLDDIVLFFREYYNDRRKKGLFVEKPKSIFSKVDFDFKDAKRVIYVYPYKRFADMQLMYCAKDKHSISFNQKIWYDFLVPERKKIESLCDTQLLKYYKRFVV